MPHHDTRLSNPFARNCVKALAKIATGSLIASCLSLGAAGYAHAKIQRSFINLSFEEPPLPSNDCWSIRVSGAEPGGTVPGWRTTEGTSSTWGPNNYGSCGGHPADKPPAGSIQLFKNFGGAAADGDQWAELNAFSAARLYQSVCLLDGDKVQWSLHHKARRGGEEKFKFNIGSLESVSGWSTIVEGATNNTGAGTITAGTCKDNCSVETLPSGWARYYGSFVWNQPSGEQTIGFEAISVGAEGNFLDAISLEGLVPFVEFDRTAAEGMEGQHGPDNFPGNILVSGSIPEGETLEVVIAIADLSTSPSDYEPARQITVSVPPGEYASTPFPIPLGTVRDDEVEPAEQFQLSLKDLPGPGGYRVANTRDCGDAVINSTLTYTIHDTEITFVKEGVFVDVAGGIDADGQPVKNAGDRMEYTFTLTNGGSADLADIVVSDTIIGTPTLDAEASDVTPEGRLPSGGKAIFRASYTITQADVDRGEITNVATVTATMPDFPDEPPLTATDQHTELLPRIPVINMVKTGMIDAETDDGDGLPDPGERLKYDITVTNDGNITALNVRPNDPGPTFNGTPGSGTMSAFTPEPVTLLPGEAQVFTAYYTLTEQDIMLASGVTDGSANTASVSSQDPSGEPITADMPEPVTMTLPGFGVEKQADVTQTYRGSKVPYTLRVRGHGLTQRSAVRLADIIPNGFAYMANSATVDGAPSEPAKEGRRLTWDLELDPDQEVEVRIVLAVPASARPGTFTNIAQVERPDNGMIYPQTGRADVEIIPEPVFDCGEIIGKVFIDRNRNGYQDEGEAGLPGARVASVDGMRITTDEHGRFSVACADMPNARIGASYIMKLDPRSLPTGYRILSENPRVVRLTAGKATQLDFATSVSRIVRLDLSGQAFLAETSELSPIWQQSIASLIATLETEPSVLRIFYSEPGGDRGLANQRIKQVRNFVSQAWKQQSDRYRLEIEARVEVGQPALAGAE